MELSKKESLSQPLISNQEGGEELVRLNPSDSEEAPNFVVADTYVFFLFSGIHSLTSMVVF